LPQGFLGAVGRDFMVISMRIKELGAMPMLHAWRLRAPANCTFPIPGRIASTAALLKSIAAKA